MESISRRGALRIIGGALAGTALPLPAAAQSGKLQSWPLNTPRSTGIHDLAQAPDGGVWFTAQRSGHLGYFDPKTGKT